MVCPRLVIAGLKGGSGKTTLAVGLVTALKGRGLKVVPFKKGPDYIDAGWLASAAGHPCYNLDPFLIGRERLLSSFIAHAEGSDIAVVEGNRGIYDGMDEAGLFSTAEVAKLLRSPVIVIIDCSKTTRTIAAMILGAQKFDPDVMIRGVVLNQIAGGRHESIIRKSIEHYCNLPVLGAIPRFEHGEFPERHMGLTPHQEHPDTARAISFAGDVAGKYLDLDRILAVVRETKPVTEMQGEKGREQEGEKNKNNPSSGEYQPVRIGVIRDSAFQFYYPENLEELKGHGAEIIEISALTERTLPPIDALYIGGGFPETHAIALAENNEFRDSLRIAIMGGLPVYAECGGLMYLGESLLLEDRRYPMAGIFPLNFSLERKPQAHGYSIVEVVHENPFYPVGTVLKGHEFHYSRPLHAGGDIQEDSYAFQMKRGQGIFAKMDGVCFRNVLATYTHLHALGAQEWTRGVIAKAREYKKAKGEEAR